MTHGCVYTYMYVPSLPPPFPSLLPSLPPSLPSSLPPPSLPPLTQIQTIINMLLFLDACSVSSGFRAVSYPISDLAPSKSSRAPFRARFQTPHPNKQKQPSFWNKPIAFYPLRLSMYLSSPCLPILYLLRLLLLLPLLPLL